MHRIAYLALLLAACSPTLPPMAGGDAGVCVANDIPALCARAGVTCGMVQVDCGGLVAVDCGACDAGPVPTCTPGQEYADGGCVAVPSGQLGASCATDQDCPRPTSCARTSPDGGAEFSFCILAGCTAASDCHDGTTCTTIPRGTTWPDGGRQPDTRACLRPGLTPCDADEGCAAGATCREFEFDDGAPTAVLACAPAD